MYRGHVISFDAPLYAMVHRFHLALLSSLIALVYVILSRVTTSSFGRLIAIA